MFSSIPVNLFTFQVSTCSVWNSSKNLNGFYGAYFVCAVFFFILPGTLVFLFFFSSPVFILPLCLCASRGRGLPIPTNLADKHDCYQTHRWRYTFCGFVLSSFMDHLFFQSETTQAEMLLSQTFLWLSIWHFFSCSYVLPRFMSLNILKTTEFKAFDIVIRSTLLILLLLLSFFPRSSPWHPYKMIDF